MLNIRYLIKPKNLLRRKRVLYKLTDKINLFDINHSVILSNGFTRTKRNLHFFCIKKPLHSFILTKKIKATPFKIKK